MAMVINKTIHNLGSQSSTNNAHVDNAMAKPEMTIAKLNRALCSLKLSKLTFP